MKSRALIVVALILGLLGGVVLHATSTSSRSTVEPHSELQSVSLDHVQVMIFASDKMTLTAQRSVIGGPLEVTATYADGTATQHCTGGSDLGGRLLPLAHITAKRGLTVNERERMFPTYVGQFSLLTFGQENDGPVTVFSSTTGNAVAFVATEYITEVAVPLVTFQRLGKACL